MDAAAPLSAFLGLAGAAIVAGPAVRHRLARKERAISKSKLRANRRHHKALKRNPLPSHPVGVGDLVDEDDLALPIWEDPRHPHHAFFWREMMMDSSLLARWTRCELYLFRAARDLWVFLVREATTMSEERKAIVYGYLDFISVFAGLVACPTRYRRAQFEWIEIKDYPLETLTRVLPPNTHDFAHLLYTDFVRWMHAFDKQEAEIALALMVPGHRRGRPDSRV